MRYRWGFTIFAVMSFASGCQVGLDVPGGTQIICASDAQCPTGFLCRLNINRCVKPGGDDVVPSAANVAISTAYTGPSRPLIVDFDVSRELQVDPIVRLGSPTAAPLQRTGKDGLHYTYSRTPGSGDEEGAWPILIDMLDNFGNAATGVALGTVVVDLTPPQVVSPSVLYSAAAGNPLERVAAAADGTTVEVYFSTTERIDGVPAVYGDCNGTRLDLVRTGDATSATFFDYYRLMGPNVVAPDGACALHAELTDLAGNPSATADLGLTASLDRTAPDAAAVFDMSRVRHLRVPYGALQTGGAIGQALVRSDQDAESNPVGTLIDAAFVAPAPGENIVELRVYPSAAGGQLLGRIQPSGGAWPVSLFPNDAAEAWITAIDASGNESVRRRVPSSEWVVTLQGKVPNSTFENPATLQLVAHAAATLQQPLSTVREATSDEYQSATFVDASVATAHGEGLWTRRLNNGTMPTARYRATMTYDPVSGESLLFGGTAETTGGGVCAPASFSNVWAWNGYRWDNSDAAEATRPLGREGSLIAVDSRRGRLVVFGGGVSATYGDTWEFDISEQRWFDRTPDIVLDPDTYEPVNSPQARTTGGMAFDTARGLVVLFGGYYYGDRNDLWLWDGGTGTWTQPAVSGTPPAPRAHFAMDYDAARDVVVVYGGWAYKSGSCPAGSIDNGVCNFTDTFEWSPATGAWSKTSDAVASLGARQEVSMAYDPVGQVSYLFGGRDPSNAPLNDVWVYGATGWSVFSVSGAKPVGRGEHGLAFDALRGRLILHGGDTYNFCPAPAPPDIWELDVATHTWTQKTPTGAVPPGRSRHTLVTGGPSGDVFLFGGYHGGAFNDVWRYSVESHIWTQISANNAAGSPPGTAFPNQMVPAAAYDWTRNVLVVIGEVASGATALPLWELNVAAGTWSQPAQGGAVPWPREQFSIAYDASRSRTVLFGGTWLPSSTCPDGAAPDGGRRYFRDVREWSGTTWTLQSYSGASPVARYGHRLHFDDDRDLMLVAGGGVGPSQTYDGSWAWNGATKTWSKLSPGVGGSNDVSYRQYHSLALDMARDKLDMFGGSDSDEAIEELDVPATGWTPWLTGSAAPYDEYFRAIAYDRTTQKVVLFGGESGISDHWVWDGGASTGPAAILEVPVAFSGVARSLPPDRLSVRVHAQAQGYAARTPTPGYDVALWDGVAWRSTGVTNAQDSSRNDTLIADTVAVGRYLYGPLRAVQAMIRPSAGNAKGVTPAQVSVDAIEVRVHVSYP